MSDKSFIYGLIGGAIAGYLTKPKQVQTVTQIIQPTQPQLPQIFDYVINLYTDKIEITDQSGSKTTLNTINELNEWLANITGKNILIWNNGYMTGDFEPTSNRYVVMGKPTRFRTVLKNSDMDIYYLTHALPEDLDDYSITNFGEYQISNVNIFAIGHPIYINGTVSGEYNESIHITAIGSRYLSIRMITGGVTAVAGSAEILDSALVDGLTLTAGQAHILNTTVGRHLYLDIGYMDTGPEIYLTDTARDIYFSIEKIAKYFGTVSPNQTVTAEVGILRSRLAATYQIIIVTGVYEKKLYAYNMLRPLSKDEAEVSVDAVNGTISVTNKTTSNINMVLIYSLALPRP
jgi:hypothetical protein